MRTSQERNPDSGCVLHRDLLGLEKRLGLSVYSVYSVLGKTQVQLLIAKVGNSELPITLAPGYLNSSGLRGCLHSQLGDRHTNTHNVYTHNETNTLKPSA